MATTTAVNHEQRIASGGWGVADHELPVANVKWRIEGKEGQKINQEVI